MKVGILLASDFTEGNGANARIKAYAKGLRDKGTNVEILFLHASSFNNTLVNNQKEGKWEGIFYKFLNNRCTRPSSISGKLWDSFKALVGSTWYILKHRKSFDLFYIYTPKFHQFFHIFLICKLLGIKTVAEKTELYSALYQNQSSTKSKLLKTIHKLDETYCHHFCSHLVVISTSLYNYYCQYFPKERISLIPIVVDMERFNHLNGHPKQPLRVGYLGSFGEKDGVPGIVKAFSMARKEFPELQLRLIGFNPDEESLEEQLKAHQLNGSVEMLGQVRYSDIPELIHHCDLLIVNRTNSDYANFGFPTKLGEYLATGRPTVVTDVGDIRYYLKHKENTYIIEPENSQALAQVIKQRYKDYEFFNQIGQKGKEATERHFDYQIHVNKLHNLLCRLTGNDALVLSPEQSMVSEKNDGSHHSNPPQKVVSNVLKEEINE